MKKTIDISTDVMERVKAKAKREGFSIPTVTELYQAWVDGRVPAPPREPHVLSSKQADKWIEELKSEAVEISRNPAD
ncbi:MAG: hypothetical protein FWF96_04835, partial [Kiritimatiellaeota bacterium]|nr:hypothetical protein [Kiritimatiellota bacterium]